MLDDTQVTSEVTSLVVLSVYLPVTVKAGAVFVDTVEEASFKIRADKVFVGFTEATVTLQVAVQPPSAVVTVIVAEPAAQAVISPLFTVATLGLLDVHVTLLFVALAGAIIALSFCDILAETKDKEALSKVTPVTFTMSLFLTHLAYNVT